MEYVDEEPQYVVQPTGFQRYARSPFTMQTWQYIIRGPLASGTIAWVVSSACFIGSLIIWGLLLGHCTNAKIGELYLFRLTKGDDVVEFGYLGMCANDLGGAVSIYMYKQVLLERFDAQVSSNLGALILTSYDLQRKFPIAFVFPVVVLVLFAVWAGVIIQKNPNGAMYQPRPYQRFEGRSWAVVVFALGFPCCIISFGSAWATMAGMHGLESLWGNLGRVDIEIQRGKAAEACGWVAAVFSTIFLAHITKLFFEVRQIHRIRLQQAEEDMMEEEEG